MKTKFNIFPFAILIGLSFNSFAGSHQQSWTPSVQPQDCVLTNTTSGLFTANITRGSVLYNTGKPECKEVIDKGYASGVKGTVKGEVDYEQWGASIKNNRFYYYVYEHGSYTFPAPIKKGSKLEIESADWIR